MTNADRIRQMTDEELAKFICHICECSSCPFESGWKCDIKAWLQEAVTGGDGKWLI